MTKRPEWPRVKCSPERDPWVRPRSRYGFTSRRGGRLVHLLRAHGPATGNTVSNPDWLGSTCGSSVRPHVPAVGVRYHLARVLALRSCTILCEETTPSTWIRQVTWLGVTSTRGMPSPWLFGGPQASRTSAVRVGQVRYGRSGSLLVLRPRSPTGIRNSELPSRPCVYDSLGT
jgi:hypothetical protein